ncbi:nuclear transport factor 2 family protein [Actinoplanes sp. CA-051413]|uniref:nuclear transport factor 2 family protein n=1 Tax=Actinoplanes sp. CA-051413 TaxID=3239899 RepID=UPI003D975611
MDFPVVERLIDAINAHDLDALTATFADDFTSTWPAHPARSFSSPQQVRRNWEAVFTQFPELRDRAARTARACLSGVRRHTALPAPPAPGPGPAP